MLMEPFHGVVIVNVSSVISSEYRYITSSYLQIYHLFIFVNFSQKNDENNKLIDIKETLEYDKHHERKKHINNKL